LAGKYSLGIYLLHPIVLMVKPYYYDKLKEKGLAYTTLEMIVNSFVMSYFAGFFFFYLIENPLMKLSMRICKRVRESHPLEPISASAHIHQV
jgi:peptidoglycan/LPS O-acetylase OafA/YrhL